MAIVRFSPLLFLQEGFSFSGTIAAKAATSNLSAEIILTVYDYRQACTKDTIRV